MTAFSSGENTVPDGGGTGKRFAWTLCWLMFASTVLNYMDRQAVSVVGDTIRQTYDLSYMEFGWVIGIFQLSYAFFQIPAGFLADRFNVRWTYAGAVIWWSLASIAVAWSPTFGALLFFRAVLGLGEAFNWPCALKVTASVLPPEDRGLGNGIFNSGAAVGAVLTPLILTPLAVRFGWRWAFALIGASGLIWVFVWLKMTRSWSERVIGTSEKAKADISPSIPQGSAWAPFATLVILSLILGVLGFSWQENVVMPVDAQVVWNVKPGQSIRAGDALGTLVVDSKPVSIRSAFDGVITNLSESTQAVADISIRIRPLGLSAFWLAIASMMVGVLILAKVLSESRLASNRLTAALGRVVRLPRFWWMCVVSISINVCWHFLINWVPSYLKSDRGFEIGMASLLSAVTFLAADAGNLGGGGLVRRLTRRGLAPDRARLLVMGISALLISLGASVGQIKSDTVTIVILGLMAFGTASFMANYFSCCQEVSASDTGLVVGILGGLGNLFAAGFAPIAGRIRDQNGDFGAVFLIVAFLPFIGVAALRLGWGKDAPVESQRPIPGNRA